MMKAYFEIEASKATPQYGFRKGLTLFGDEGYQCEEDDMDDQSPRVNRALRKLKSNLSGDYWSREESAYGHMVLAMMVA